ncbi:hypothetical protein [Tautonia sociabilis]|uniref:Uncharacterized protein n=1 Tax=Tautonia sociabilis TaxID=2080755 RepID=A0A432MMR7_9BACT|nr:hypothetical protein [Tautonia sociabilis]RUL88487.1 hypothetical protein TsocGM_07175 [Tautonia sociabilis]
MPFWPFTRPEIGFEQAVYGSFPFWHRGYDLLGRSPGCRPEWVAGMKEACQRLGERRRGESPPGGLVSRWLADGCWMVLRPFSPGSDDVGRPDAVAFHALFLQPKAAATAAFDPFQLLPAFREDFGPDSDALPSGAIALSRSSAGGQPADARVEAIVEALCKGCRVLVESDGPIDPLAGRVWERLPRRVRHRRSLATWAYSDSGIFDLVGLARLTGIDPSDRRLLLLPAAERGERPPVAAQGGASA